MLKKFFFWRIEKLISTNERIVFHRPINSNTRAVDEKGGTRLFYSLISKKFQWPLKVE